MRLLKNPANGDADQQEGRLLRSGANLVRCTPCGDLAAKPAGGGAVWSKERHISEQLGECWNGTPGSEGKDFCCTAMPESQVPILTGDTRPKHGIPFVARLGFGHLVAAYPGQPF